MQFVTAYHKTPQRRWTLIRRLCFARLVRRRLVIYSPSLVRRHAQGEHALRMYRTDAELLAPSTRLLKGWSVWNTRL